MTSRAVIWGFALVGSLSTHAAAFAGLLPFLRPDPPPQQPSPQSSLTVAAQQVARSKAIERRAPVELGEARQPRGDRLDARSVPASHALPIRVAPQNLSPSPPLASQLAAQPPTGDSLTDSQPKSSSVGEATASAARVSLLAPEQQKIAPSQRDALFLTDATPPAPPARPQVPSSEPLAESSAKNQSNSVSEASARPQVLEQALPDSEHMVAALAFQSGAVGEIDPVSLAAFQSFTRQEDLKASATGLRDGVTGLLSAVPCARLQVAFDPETATLELRGHIPEDGLRAPVLAALQAQMGRDISLSDKMRLLPRPQCGALSGISTVGLPQSTDQITNPLLLGADAQARVLSYAGGEQLFFNLTAPDYPAYLYVDYFDAAGNVIHLSPNEAVPLGLATPKSAVTVGARNAGDSGLLITVGPPYGQEIAVAFAASSPLYEGLRPLSEPAAPYLTFLREKISEIRSQDTDFKGEWVYFLVETRAN